MVSIIKHKNDLGCLDTPIYMRFNIWVKTSDTLIFDKLC